MGTFHFQQLAYRFFRALADRCQCNARCCQAFGLLRPSSANEILWHAERVLFWSIRTSWRDAIPSLLWQHQQPAGSSMTICGG
jgi:hypothetical protein